VPSDDLLKDGSLPSTRSGCKYTVDDALRVGFEPAVWTLSIGMK
jgi:hypothetical protein